MIVQTTINLFDKTKLTKCFLLCICAITIAYLTAVKPYFFPVLMVLGILCCVIVIKPVVGLLLLIYTAPIEKIYYYKFFTIKPVIVFTLLTFFVLVTRGLMSKKLQLNKSIAGFAFLFLITTLLSALNAVELELCIRLAFLYLVGFVVVYVVYNYIDSDEKLKFVLKHFFIATLVCVLYGYLQYFSYVFFGFNLDRYVFPDTLQINSVLYDMARGLHIVPKWSYAGRIAIRANSSFTDPNAFAVYVNFCLALMLTSSLFYLRRSSIHKFLKRFILFLLFCGAVLISISRTGILELLFIIIVAVVICNKKASGSRKLSFLLLLGGVTCFCFTLFSRWFDLIFMDRLNNLLSISSGHERVAAAKAAFDMFFLHPFIGVGAYNYGQIYGRFYDPGYLTMSPHNTYLAVLSETGLFGTSIFIGFLYLLYRRTRNYIRRAEGYNQEVIGYGLLAGFLGLLCSFLFYQTYMLPMVWLYYGILLSLKRPRGGNILRSKDVLTIPAE